MESFKRKKVMCTIDKHCVEWTIKFMGYCLCNKKDGFSLALGLISVVSWVVAEIPQIITNYKQKSAEGLSIAFILTWIVGDLFNLAGCLLEPATLPTQYYMAMLYLATTSTLAIQALYYEHIYPRMKSNRRRHETIQTHNAKRKDEHPDDDDDDREQVNNEERMGVAPRSPIPLSASFHDSDEEAFFVSARSLSVSHTPTRVSFLAQRMPTSDAERWSFNEPLLGKNGSPRSVPTPKAKAMLCLVSFTIFFIGSCDRHLTESHSKVPTGGIVLPVGRRFLLEATGSGGSSGDAESIGIGSYLGWGMAFIYLSGRLPQICLNIRRGNAEGLNPLMFIFALIGNVTYVASILVSSVDWKKIRPNLPWLVDAGGCVLLDAFILVQFIYFRHRSARQVEKHVS